MFRLSSTEPLDPDEEAESPEDYGAVSDTVEIADTDYVAVGTAWRAEKTVEVPIEDDLEDEPDERLKAGAGGNRPDWTRRHLRQGRRHPLPGRGQRR